MTTSNTTFPFTPLSFPTKFREARVPSTTTGGIEGGLVLRRNNLPSPGWIYVATFSIKSGRNSNTKKTWDDWVEDFGGHTAWLFKAPDMLNRTASDYNPNREVVSEAVGTGDGSNTTFNLDMLHIDSSNLSVYIDGGNTTAFTLSGNNSAPAIVFTAAPGNTSAVTASYEFYMPVVLVSADAPQTAHGGQWTVGNIVVREVQPGGHLA